LKEKLSKIDPDLLFADGYDDCIIGLTFRDQTPVVLYSADRIIYKLSGEMAEDEAVEFFDFNIAGAYMGERTPLFWYNESPSGAWGADEKQQSCVSGGESV
jgi:hypothetical protein